jgi:gluconolactonase
VVARAKIADLQRHQEQPHDPLGPTTGTISDFRKPADNANGNSIDRQGRLITCQHRTASITRTEADGTITTLASSFEGQRFNSPNDIVCKSDGSIWFTDPAFGPTPPRACSRRSPPGGSIASIRGRRPLPC